MAAPTTLVDTDDVPVGTAGNPVYVSGAPLLLGDVITVTPTLDTNAYAAGDVLFEQAAGAGLVRVAGGRGIIQNVTVIDADDQGAAFDLYFCEEAVDFGTLNSPPTISDADAVKVTWLCEVQTTDYNDLGGVKLATIQNLTVEIESAATTGYFAAVAQGAATYTASGLTLRVGVLW